MKTYYVSIPITGKVTVEVKANNKEEAIEEALGRATLDDIEEWDAHREVVKGNVFYGTLNEIDVYEEEDEED